MQLNGCGFFSARLKICDQIWPLIPSFYQENISFHTFNFTEVGSLAEELSDD
jgi:hypothetical protein